MQENCALTLDSATGAYPIERNALAGMGLRRIS